MAQAAWADGPPLARLEHIPHDDSWVKCLPAGCTIISAVGYGSSYWSQAGKIDFRLEDGSVSQYFIKLSMKHIGRIMLEGEYESMKALHSVSPDITPKPIGYGTFDSDADTHFFLCEFIDMHEKLPDTTDFCSRMADLHSRSQDLSQNGKFGFQVTTCNGSVPQYTKWTTSWEEFVIESLKDRLRQEQEVHGFSQELADLTPSLYEKVCPRLLRPLETEGRILRPTLTHGDLWHGNVSIQSTSNLPCIYDSSALWAHNEYDMHAWRPAHMFLNKAFAQEYFKFFPPSPPEETGMIGMRCMRCFRICMSRFCGLRRGGGRGCLIEDMRRLVEKFSGGYQGGAERKGEGGESETE